MHRSLLALALSALVCAAAALTHPQAPTGLRLNHMEKGVLTLDVDTFRMAWTNEHTGRGQVQSAYRVLVWAADNTTTASAPLARRGPLHGGRAHAAIVKDLPSLAGLTSSSLVWDSGVVASASPRAVYAGPALTPVTDYLWAVQWFDVEGDASVFSEPAPFHRGPTAAIWDPALWIGGGANMFRKEFTLSSVPAATKLYISGLGFFQVFVNGQRVNTDDALAGAWTTFNTRNIFYTYDITSFLQTGNNAIGVLLGVGWRDLSVFNVNYNGSSCDQNERIFRAAAVSASGLTVVKTDATWTGTTSGPIKYDSVYNGETYDARAEIPGWSNPGTSPLQGTWTNATFISCFSSIMTPISFPNIGYDGEHKPVKITQLQGCPAGVMGAIVAENAVLNLTCASGTIQNIDFASFGTPSGTCGSYAVGSCNSANSVSVVQKLCVGKSSCVVPATNTVFGADPCYDTAKALAVQVSGCTPPATSAAYVVDFGENLSGFCRLSVKGPAGTQVVLKHAEVLQHPPYGPADGNIYQGNLRTALATDTYILKGDPNGEVYTPHFTYHGFRFVEVDGYPGELTVDDITQLHFHTLNPIKTNFSSSSQVLNAIQYGAIMGQGSNQMSVPTDCDQRDERLGWMGDAGLTADSFNINYDYTAFIESYLQIMVDDQPADGSLPDVVPFMRYGNRPADPSWSAAFPQNIYVQYQHGNTDPAKTFWTQIMLYLQNLANQLSAAGGMKNWNPSYGDWVPAGNKVPGQVCSSFNYIVNVQQMAEVATAIGSTSDATRLTALAASLVGQFNDAFFSTSAQCWSDCGQAANAMGAFINAVPSARSAVASQLVNDIVTKNNNHVTGGIIGVKALFPVLTQLGQQAAAVDLAEQTSFPSWGYMFFNDVEPATSNVWELWDGPTEGPGMNSRNHHMFSSISAWLVQTVGGVTGFSCSEEVQFTPASALGVSHASTSVKTPCGTISHDYTRSGGVQCLKHPEGKSSVKPILPVVEDGLVSCGPNGGIITGVSFASFGAPSGTCGSFTAHKTCHDPSSQSVVEDLCVGKPSCTVPSHGDFWAANMTCPDLTPRGLWVSVTCSEASSVSSSVRVPVGVTGRVSLPAYAVAAKDAAVFVDDVVVFKSGSFVGGLEGVYDTVVSKKDSVSLEVTLGSGEFTVRVAPLA